MNHEALVAPRDKMTFETKCLNIFKLFQGNMGTSFFCPFHLSDVCERMRSEDEDSSKLDECEWVMKMVGK
jgi:hypothetical protein